MALILAFSGLTAAQSATTQVKLCLYSVKGTVRLVSNSTTKCSKGEKLLTLGTQGPRGPEGPSGIPGESGPQGPRGLKGDKGDKGDPGTNGTNGVNGSAGPRGLQGLPGERGLQGLTGPSLVVLDANNTFVGYLVDTQLSYLSGKISMYVVWNATAQRGFAFLPSGSLYTSDFSDYGPLFTSSDCTGTAYLTAADTSQYFQVNSTIVVKNAAGADAWYALTATTVADAETITFGSTLSGNTCSTSVSPASITGPVSEGVWILATPTTSPLPTIVGPLRIGVQ
jgi:hypothetical protein